MLSSRLNWDLVLVFFPLTLRDLRDPVENLYIFIDFAPNPSPVPGSQEQLRAVLCMLSFREFS